MDGLATIQSTVAISGGLITAYFAIVNFRKSIEQRQEELKWKRANVARDVVHEIHSHEKASDAVLMLDWYINTNIFTLTEHKDNKEVTTSFTVTYNEVLEALQKAGSPENPTPKQYYILDSFDWFFYYIDRIEQYLRSGLIVFNDVDSIFYPYYLKVTSKNDHVIFETFMKERHYDLAPRFWQRFKQKKNGPTRLT